jgi:hypothetical protein
MAECIPCKARYLKCKEISNRLDKQVVDCNKIDRTIYIENYIDLQKSKFIEDDKEYDFCKTVWNDSNDDFINDAAQKDREDQDVLKQCFGGLTFSKATKDESNYIKNTLKNHEYHFRASKKTMLLIDLSIGILCLIILASVFL